MKKEMDQRLREAWDNGRSVKNIKETIGMEYVGTILSDNRYYKFFFDKEENEYRFWTWRET